MLDCRGRWTTFPLIVLLFTLVIPGVSLLAAEAETTGRQELDGDVEGMLAKALEHYYNEQYEQALPLLRRLNEKMGGMEVSFWLATSAHHTGDYDLAIEAYRDMLAQNPDLPRVRLDLADALIKTGQLDEAKKELETVLATDPPDAVKRKIQDRLSSIVRQQDKFRWSGLVAQGIQHDDNLSSGPDQAIINDAIYSISLPKSNTKISGENWLTKVRLDTWYDVGQERGLVWHSGGFFYNSHNLDDYSQFNYLTVDLYTGPWWISHSGVIKLPVGYNDKHYGNERLSSTIHVDPSAEYFLLPKLSLQTGYTYAVENYAPQIYQNGDYQLHRFLAGPRYYIDKRNQIVTGQASWENHRAEDSSKQSFDAMGATLSYYLRLNTQTEVNVFYNWSGRRFDDAPTLYNEIRKDQRHIVTAAVSQRFLKYLFASVEYSFIDNRSNADLYSYSKNVYTFNLGAVY